MVQFSILNKAVGGGARVHVEWMAPWRAVGQ